MKQKTAMQGSTPTFEEGRVPARRSARCGWLKVAGILASIGLIVLWLLVPSALSLLIAQPGALSREGYASAMGILIWIILAILLQPISIAFTLHMTLALLLVFLVIAAVYALLVALGLERRPQGQLPSRFSGSFISDGLLAPIDEELLFRGIVLGLLMHSLPVLPALLVSAVLFLAVHEIARVGGVRRSLRESLADLFFGLLAGLLYIGFGSILLPILLHVLINGLGSYTRPSTDAMSP